MHGHACPGCGCEIISGLLWVPPHGQAQLCCNKRCANKAQRKHDERSSPAKARRKPKAPPPPPAGQPEPERCWSSLSRDVLALLGRHLTLRDRLAGALTCRHWRAQLTQGVTYLDIALDLCSDGAQSSSTEAAGDPAAGAAGGGRATATTAATITMIDSARGMMPQVDSVSVSAPALCLPGPGPGGALLPHLAALSRWTQLRHLRLEVAPLPPEPDSDLEEESSSCDSRHEPTALDALCLGALGRLTGLASLCLTAHLYGEPGLYGLSCLEGLTRLELRRPNLHEGPCMDWDASDADLAALTRLRSLVASAPLLPPSCVGALGALPALTSLSLLDLDMAGYGAWQGEVWAGTEEMGAAVARLVHVRCLTVEACDPSDDDPDMASAYTDGLRDLVRGLQQLCAAQQERAERQQQQQQQLAQPQQHQAQGAASPPRTNNPSPASRRRRSAAGEQAQPGAPSPPPHAPSGGTTAAASDPWVGPAAVHLRCLPPGGALSYELDDELLEGLAGVGGLVNLSLGCCGGSGSLYILTSLTRLTRLELRCGPDCRPGLGAWDMAALAAAWRSLAVLSLALPADLLDEQAAEGLALLPCLRDLTLRAVPYTREVPYERAELRERLVGRFREAAALEGGARREGGGEGSGARAGKAAADGGGGDREDGKDEVGPADGGAVQAACAATDEAAGTVPHAVGAVAAGEAPAQEHEAAEPDAAPASPAPEDGPPVAASAGPAPLPAAGPAPAAAPPPAAEPPAAELDAAVTSLLFLQQLYSALQVGEVGEALEREAEWREQQAAQAAAAQQEGQQEGQEGQGAGSVAAAGGAGAQAMPRLPGWVVPPQEEEEEDEDGEGASAPAGAGCGASAAQAAAPAPQPVPLHELSYDQLCALKRLVVREEVVTGPAFRLDAWLPRRLQRAALAGFAGLAFPPARRAGGAGGAGGTAGGVGGGGAGLLPCLVELQVEVAGDAEEAEAAEAGLAAWRERCGAAPALREVAISAIAACAAAPSVGGGAGG